MATGTPANYLAKIMVLLAHAGIVEGKRGARGGCHITKLTWDNAALLAPETAKTLGVGPGEVVRVRGERGEVSLPALPVPGMHPQVVALALGYGRLTSARFADLGPRWLQRRETVGENGLVGVRVVQLSDQQQGLVRLQAAGVSLTPTGKRVLLACTQDHHRLEVPEHLRPSVSGQRDVVQEVGLGELGHSQGHGELASLWPEDFPPRGHR